MTKELLQRKKNPMWIKTTSCGEIGKDFMNYFVRIMNSPCLVSVFSSIIWCSCWFATLFEIIELILTVFGFFQEFKLTIQLTDFAKLKEELTLKAKCYYKRESKCIPGKFSNCRISNRGINIFSEESHKNQKNQCQ